MEDNKKSVSFKETPEIIDDSIKSNYHTVEKIQKRKKDNGNKEIENTPVKSSNDIQPIVDVQVDNPVDDSIKSDNTFDFFKQFRIMPNTQTIAFIFVLIICFFIFILNTRVNKTEELKEINDIII